MIQRFVFHPSLLRVNGLISEPSTPRSFARRVEPFGWTTLSSSCIINHEGRATDCSGVGMRIEGVIWDEDDDFERNVAHIAEHDITIDEVEDVLYDPRNRTVLSNHPGRMLTCGWTERFICVA